MKGRLFSFLSKGEEVSRSFFAYLMILISVGGIVVFGFPLFGKLSAEGLEDLFHTVLPVFASWVGTVLAYYFGKDSFKAAGNQYKDIVKGLSPEQLDDVTVEQIMITEKTLVKLEYSKVQAMSVPEITTFLKTVEKSRLPVFENGKPKYIIHESTLAETQKQHPEGDASFADLEKLFGELISSFLVVEKEKTLEEVLKKMPASKNIKDVFVVDPKDGKVLGWLTDTLILRYVKS